MIKARQLIFVLVTCILINSFARADETPVPPENQKRERTPVQPNKDRATTLEGEYYSADKSQRIQDICYDGNIPEDENEMPASNPANVRCSAALFVYKSGKWVFSDDINLGQGEVKKFANFQLTVETLEYDLSEDALCCPSVKNTLVFDTRSGKFVQKNTVKLRKLKKNEPE